MNSKKLTNYKDVNRLNTVEDTINVKAKHLNNLIEDVESIDNKLNTLEPSTNTITIDTISERTSGAGVIADGVKMIDSGIQLANGVVQKEAVVTLTAAQIVGNTAGTLGHANGVTLVAAPGTDYTLELVSATAFFNGMGVAYTGGADDTVIQLGTVAMTGVVTKANLLGATGDKIVMFKPLSTAALPLTVNTTLNIKSTTAWTQPETAAGTLQVRIVYRLHTTGF